jgi:TrpR-related protein YerC/YecD
MQGKQFNSKRTRQFLASLTLLAKKENVNEVYSFLKEVFTLSEIEAMSDRLEIAYRLIDKQRYRSIAQEMRVSTKTITQVAKRMKARKYGIKLAHQHYSEYRNNNK